MISFFKYHGTGNDFILSEEITDPSPGMVAALCNRRKGVGADGLILMEVASDTDARMRIFNADGSRASMCGNGLRCVVRRMMDRAVQRGNASFNEFTVTCGGRRYRARKEGGRIAVGMGIPVLVEKDLFYGMPGYRIDAGAPHLICLTDDIETDRFQSIARSLCYHDRFVPEGVNAGLASFLAPDRIRLRIYEKGVEGETLSCGTGGTAAAFLAWKRYGVTKGITVEFFSGEVLTFDLLSKDRIVYEMNMLGSAVCVFEGLLNDVSFSRRG